MGSIGDWTMSTNEWLLTSDFWQFLEPWHGRWYEYEIFIASCTDNIYDLENERELLGDMIDHVGIYGSRVAEGLSAFNVGLVFSWICIKFFLIVWIAIIHINMLIRYSFPCVFDWIAIVYRYVWKSSWIFHYWMPSNLGFWTNVRIWILIITSIKTKINFSFLRLTDHNCAIFVKFGDLWWNRINVWRKHLVIWFSLAWIFIPDVFQSAFP